MIFLKNYGRRLATIEDEIAAIKRHSGLPVIDHDNFDLIELRYKSNGKNPIKVHGFQDTDIQIDTRGEPQIAHREAGRGVLRFVPDSYNNRMGYLARTPHNMKMLSRHWRDNEWVYPDKKIETEIEDVFKKWWESLGGTEEGQKQKREVLSREEKKRKKPTDLPANYGTVKGDDSADKLLDEIAKLREENVKLRKGEEVKPQAETKPTEPVKEEENVTPELSDAKKVESQDIDDMDLEGMRFFKLQGMARNLGVHPVTGVPKPELIQKIKELNGALKQGIT